MATEAFANFPATTVPAGADGNSGTETWIVSSSDGFPTASTGVTQFHVADTNQAASSELILVTNMSGEGNTTWAVTRGAEGTNPVVHEPGFTITAVITAGWLNGVTGSSLPAGTAGALLYGNPASAVAWLGGNVTSAKELLTSPGSGGTANTPAWGTIAAADVPTLNQNTTGTASNVTGTVAVLNGGTGGTAATAYTVITGGTAATAPFQHVASLGTAGRALTSNGPGALPTWQQGVLLPSGDATGATDYTNLAALIAGGTSITLASGAFYFSQPVLVNHQNVTIAGQGRGSTILNFATGFADSGTITPSGFLAPAIFQLGLIDSSANNAVIRSLTIQGISSTTTSNPFGNGINNGGNSGVQLTDLNFTNVNGWPVEAISGPSQTHEVVRGFYDRILIVNCAGNIHINGQGYTVNCVMSNINCPSSGVTTGSAANLDGIFLDHCDDVVMVNVNAGNGNSGSPFHMTNCSAVWLTNTDTGGGTATSIVLIDGSSSGIFVSNGTLQGGAPPVTVTGTSQHVTFLNMEITGSQTDGADVGSASPGQDIVFQNCYFGQGSPPNGQGASGTNYDLNWSGNVRGQVNGCRFTTPIVTSGSAGVQFSVNVTANQNVSFTNCEFTGSGASSSNWFTATPAAALLSSSTGYNFLAGAAIVLAKQFVPGNRRPGHGGLVRRPGLLHEQPVPVASQRHRRGGRAGGRSWATVSTFYMVLSSGGTGLTSSECFGAIYSGSGTAGTLLGYTADQSSAWEGSNGLLTMSLTAASTGSLALAPGRYFGSIYANGGTLPKFMSSSGSPYYGAINAGATSSGLRAANLFTGATSTVPTICTFSGGSILYWMAIK